MATLPLNKDPRLLVGMETADDAGVYQLTEDMALVQTVDFITPPVDDPFVFGQVAAANALSDVYAMGGTPLTALNLVGFPSHDLPLAVLERIIAGALSKVHEAGAVLAGGHSTEDEEPKFGLSVTGVVHPKRIWRNSTAQVGDKLILTKPLGSGVLFNANRKALVSPGALEQCLRIITTLNRAPAETLQAFPVHACTDITGFGLAGHVYEMAKGATLTFRLNMAHLPVMDEALDMYRRGITTGVNASNRELVGTQARFISELPEWHREIVFDPQTSGGLMVALPADHVARALQALHHAGVEAARVVGEVLPLGSALVEFV